MNQKQIDLTQLNLANFVKENRIDRLSETNNLKLLEIARDEFNESEQKLFVESYRFFQNFDERNDYIIDFDMAWKLCGYTRKDTAKKTLVKRLKENLDYKIFKISPDSTGESIPLFGGMAPNKMGGLAKESIMLTMEAFRFFCMSSNTEQGRKTQEFFSKTLSIIFKAIHGQNQENTKALENALALENARDVSNENNLIKGNADTHLVYLASVGENLVKFGYTKRDIGSRVKKHKSVFPEFLLRHVVPTKHCEELEQDIKNTLNEHIVTKKFNENDPEKNFTCTEIIELKDGFTLNELYDSVLELRMAIENKKANRYEEKISKMWLDLEKYKSMDRKKNRCWSKIKPILEECGVEYEEFRLVFEGKIEYHAKRKQFIKFFKKLYYDNENQENWWSNKELYDIYRDFVSERQCSAYCFSYKKFFDEFAVAFKDSYKISRRVTVKQGEPGYDKNKNQTALGKELIFDRQFVCSLCDLSINM